MKNLLVFIVVQGYGDWSAWMRSFLRLSNDHLHSPYRTSDNIQFISHNFELFLDVLELLQISLPMEAFSSKTCTIRILVCLYRSRVWAYLVSWALLLLVSRTHNWISLSILSSCIIFMCLQIFSSSSSIYFFTVVGSFLLYIFVVEIALCGTLGCLPQPILELPPLFLELGFMVVTNLILL